MRSNKIGITIQEPHSRVADTRLASHFGHQIYVWFMRMSFVGASSYMNRGSRKHYVSGFAALTL